MSDAEKTGGGDPETLKGGKILRYLVRRARDRDPRHYMDALNCLRDSQVVVPCVVGMSDAALRMFRNAKAGDVIAPDESLRFVPDMIKSGGEFYLPVFSNHGQMGENYRSGSSTITMDFLEAMEIASARKELSGIVLDAFTVPLYITKNLFDLARSLPSRLDPEKSKRFRPENY